MSNDDKTGRSIIEIPLLEQMNQELQNAYYYLSIATYYQKNSLNGFANFFINQSQEELEHSEKFRQYLIDRKVNIVFKTLQPLETNFADLLEPIHLSLNLEKENTKQIKNLYELALKDKDYQTLEFLNWFLKEQLEEEKQFEELLDRLTLITDTNLAFLLIDNELKKQ